MILGVTLARGGSKGIPKKNIAPCAGKPLIAWTIEAAQNSRLLERYIVSTDDEDIATEVNQHGVELALRPKCLSGDTVNRWDVLKDIVRKIPYPTIVLLQATSPIRKPGRIDECIQTFLDGNYDSLATGLNLFDRPYPENRGKNRQQITPWFFDDGNVYIWKRELIECNQYQEAGEKYAIIETEPAEHIDINNQFDLWLAEQILNASPFCQTK